jgi:hypothetical protein
VWPLNAIDSLYRIRSAPGLGGKNPAMGIQVVPGSKLGIMVFRAQGTDFKGYHTAH